MRDGYMYMSQYMEVAYIGNWREREGYKYLGIPTGVYV